jgi:hypothetical protein
MKNIKTIVIGVVIAVLGFVVFSKVNEKKSSLSSEAISNFAIKDTSSIDRINLSDTQGRKMSFIKTGKVWTLENGKCIQQHMIYIFLETFKFVAVKGPVPVGAIDNVNKTIMAHHKKIEIFQNGKLHKTWYVGNATRDHEGTYMLLKDPVLGKSPEPFIMYLANMHGNLLDRFSTNYLDYVCSEVYKYDPLNINTVDVVIPDSSHLNYRIELIAKNTFELYNNDLKIETFDTTKVRAYLNSYRKIHFEFHNRTASQEKIDSLKLATPFYTINVTDNTGDVNGIKAYKKMAAFEQRDFNGDIIIYDPNKLWVFTRYDELTVCQYHVFDKLFRDINFFKL